MSWFAMRSNFFSCLGPTILFATATCPAAGPIGQDGTPITTSDYSLDLYQGSVYAGQRVTGLAGAYVAIAEDVDGDLQNAATPANRPFYSTTHFDWWVGMGMTFPGALSNMDFFNSSSDSQKSTAPENLIFVTPALNLQWGKWGMGATVEFGRYGIDAKYGEDGATAVDVTLATSHLQVARTFWKDQISLGVGARLLVMNLEVGKAEESIFQSTGIGAEFGALFRPNHKPYRLGLALRSGIRTEADPASHLTANEAGDIILEGEGDDKLYIPTQVSLPWDANVGAAYQWGRPFNLGWRNPDKEYQQLDAAYSEVREDRDAVLAKDLAEAADKQSRRDIKQRHRAAAKDEKKHQQAQLRALTWRHKQRLADMKRHYLLVSTALVVSGRSKSAVGVESFLNQTVHRSGESVVFSPRLGAESEIWPDVLTVRGGSYLEPARFDDASPRVHGTAGFALRLLRWGVFGIAPDDYLWKLKFSADVAARYFTWGVMVGGWYPRHQGKIPQKYQE